MANEKTNSRRIVAERLLRTATGLDVVATLLEPVKKGEEWECAFRITGLPTEVNERVIGVDSMQAVALGMEGLRVYLGQAAEPLTWLDGEPGDIGFPRLIPGGFGVEMEKHLVKVVRDELTRMVAVKANAKGVKWPPDKP